ncbi:hypothetical protein ACIQMP_16375 [Streptomyces sp. NPDC091385]|uniref:hypothetical protein n=1 Tax=Streptomyces sp. NPDC091385 TaxID=3365997 RepID=UPI0037FBB47D
MEKPQSSRARLLHWKDIRVVLLFLLAFCVCCAGGWVFLNKGIYLLPDRMCAGTLGRDTAERVLPRAMSADSDSSVRGAGADLEFWCRVDTSGDASLSGEARVRPVGREQWVDYYRGSGNRIVRVTVGNVEALAQVDADRDTSSVYVPCAPPGVPSYNASRPYAVVAEVRTRGRVRGSGLPVRQELTDFAYALTRHAYDLAECKPQRDFPEELPRYKQP